MPLFAVPALNDNYIWICSDAQGRAIAVDPGEAAPLETFLVRENLELTTVLLTHHHPDHIAGVAALSARRKLRVIAPADKRIHTATEIVHDGDRIDIDAPAMHFSVLSVPGHTSSHVAYVGEGWLFCGDTLFSLGCGRLFEGTPAQMLASLDRLAQCPDATQICCGHEYTLDNAAFALSVDPDNTALQHRRTQAQAQRAVGQPSLPSSMADERAANPFLRIDTPALQAWATARLGHAATRVDRFAALRSAKNEFRA
ncbi:MAG: hydroxyacylglutathione hydrolase [Xanthomonadales bacterium]|nr:hydroxyacylglutathione hydrolase [Xanthomonadales bacterium]